MTTDRDYSIDFFKGICTIGIIFIHTVWWSGQGYVPNIIAQYSLLLDVPLFFFLSGASATYSFKKEKPFSGLVRLINLFLVFFIIYAIFFVENDKIGFILKSIFLLYPVTTGIEVVQGSTWFIPVFFIVYFISYLIIKHLNNNLLPLINLTILYLMYNFSSIPSLHELNFFSINSSYILTYLLMFLFGYYYFDTLKNYKWASIFGIFLFIVSYIILYLYFKENKFDLQSLKFPPRFHYIIASFLSIAITIIFSKYITKNYWINYLGKNALHVYIAQGISSSLLILFTHKINLEWELKLLILFSVNLLLSISLSILIKKLFELYMKLITPIFLNTNK